MPSGRDVDPLDQQPEDAGLLGWVELVSDRLERAERLGDLTLPDHDTLGGAVLPVHREDVWLRKILPSVPSSNGRRLRPA